MTTQQQQLATNEPNPLDTLCEVYDLDIGHELVAAAVHAMTLPEVGMHLLLLQREDRAAHDALADHIASAAELCGWSMGQAMREALVEGVAVRAMGGRDE